MQRHRMIHLLVGWLCGALIACNASNASPAPTATFTQPASRSTAVVGPASPSPTIGEAATPLLPAAPTPADAQPAATGFAIRFFGSSVDDRDRIKIPLGTIDSAGRLTSSRPVNLSGDVTIEFWMKATAADNAAPDCDGWYYGNIIIDRDIFGAGDYGDYGIAICNGRLVVGFSVGNDDRLLKGSQIVTDGNWRHIAITRASSGQVRLFIDGQPDGTLNGPVGRIDYRLNRSTDYPNSDPYLVLGAEKHDYPGSRYYNGLIDDLRLSNIIRYTAPFTRPTAPHSVDSNTVALYRFDEGSGIMINDSATGGQNAGELKPGAGGAAQHWSNDTPFSASSSPLIPRAYIPFVARS